MSITSVRRIRGAAVVNSSLRAALLFGTALTAVAVHAEEIVVNQNGDYTLTRSAPISGGPNVVDITTTNGSINLSFGDIENTTNSDLIGQGSGISANTSNTANAIDIQAGNISSNSRGITGVKASSAGAITIVADSINLTAVSSKAVVASGGSVSIRTNNFNSGGDAGIRASGGTVNIISGTASSVGSNGQVEKNGTIFAEGGGTGGITIQAGTTTATSGYQSGIQAISDGDLSITSTSVSVGTDGGVNAGISAYSLGKTVIRSGSITTNGAIALRANSPAGSIDIESASINSAATAIAIRQDTGTTKIVNGSITTSGEFAHGIQYQGGGNLTIVSDTIQTAGNRSDGITVNPQTASSGAVSITSRLITSSASASVGIRVRGDGPITIDSGTVDISSSTTTAIQALGSGAISIKSALVKGSGSIYAQGSNSISVESGTIDAASGIVAIGTGTRPVTVISTGPLSISGDFRPAILASGNGVVTVSNSSAITTRGPTSSGILASTSGSGSVVITNSGSVTTTAEAISATATGGAVTVTSRDASSAKGAGIRATGSRVNVTATNTAGAGDGYSGIFALGTNDVVLNIGSASANGANNGPERADGVYGQSMSGKVQATIGSASATGGDAIHLAATGRSGEITAKVTGSAVSTGGFGIWTTGATDLDISGFVKGGGATAIQLGTGNDKVTLRTGAQISGTIVGGGGTDRATLNGSGLARANNQSFGGFSGFDSASVESGYWTTDGTSALNSATIAAGATLDVLNGASGLAFKAPTITDNGTLVIRSSTASAGSTLGTTTISGSGSVLFTGAGAATLDGTNNITTAGGIVVDGGSNVVLTGTQSGLVATNAGGTFTLGTGGTTGLFTGDLINNGTFIFNRSDDYLFSGAFSGSGSLTKRGAGTLTFGGSYNFTGITTIEAGQVRIGGSSSLSPNAALDVSGSATLDISNTNQSVAGLSSNSGGASINITGGSLTTDQSTNTSFAGSITGTGARLIKAGSGTLTLTGNNSYTGGTAISGGTLQIGAGGTSGAIVGDVVDNGTLRFNRSDSISFAGVVSGTGSLNQAGTGTLILSGNNSYTGGTTISGGTLQIGAGGTSGAIVGDVVDNGTLRFNRSDSVAFAGAVSGTGSLNQAGTGTLILSGNNSYTGGTTISGGTVQIGAGGTSGAIVGDVVDNGTLRFNRSDSVAFAGAVSGTGSLNQAGTGTLILSGNNIYTGGTTISGGTLQIGAGGTSGAIVGDVVDNGTLRFNRSDSPAFAGVISGTGSLNQAGSGTLTLTGSNSYTGGTTISGGTLQVGAGGTSGVIVGDVANNGALRFNRSDGVAFTGAISGSGSLTKTGSGTLNLTGNSTYTGATTVSGGRLAVNGSIVSAVTVQSGARLGGTGSVGGAAITTGGVYAPGNSIGTQTVNGNVSFAAGSIYEVETNADGRADRVNATGTATISGGTVRVLAEAGTYDKLTSYTILQANGGVTGTFANATSNFAFLDPILTYSANAVTLNLARNDLSFGAIATSANQLAVANAVQGRGLGNPLYNAVLLQTTDGGRAAFDALSGELHATVSSSLLDAGRRVRDAVLDRAQVGGEGIGIWGQLQRNAVESKNAAGAAASRTDRKGIVSGVDYGSGNGWRVGAHAGYIDSRIIVGTRASRADVDTTIAGIYGGWASGPLSIVAGADYMWHKADTRRTVTISGLAGTANQTASYDANTRQAYVQASYVLVDGPAKIAPFIGYNRVSVRTDAVAEAGNAAALNVAKQGRSLDLFTAGGRMSGDIVLNDSVRLQPHFQAAAQLAYGDRQGVTAASFTGGSATFTTVGARIGRKNLSLDGGLDFVIQERFRIGAGGFMSTSGEWNDYGANVSLGYRF